MIKVQDVAKSFGDVQAVKGVSFTAKDGQITTFLGANGSGKSTTLRAVAGLLKVDGGYVEVDGINVASHTKEAQELLGVFPDTFGLYSRLTTREHLVYFAELHGLFGAKQQEAIDSVASKLHMADIMDRRAEGFSQGQRMKVALARALVHMPKNIVLDEPTRGLDVVSIRLLRTVLQQLRDAGHCVLLSSHVMAEVAALSDHIVMISDGKVCAEGTSASLMGQAGKDDLEEAFVSLVGLETV